MGSKRENCVPTTSAPGYTTRLDGMLERRGQGAPGLPLSGYLGQKKQTSGRGGGIVDRRPGQRKVQKKSGAPSSQLRSKN